MPEDAEVSKIISGQRNVAKNIIYLYQSSFGVAELKTALEGIFDDLSDAAYMKEQILSDSMGRQQYIAGKETGIIC